MLNADLLPDAVIVLDERQNVSDCNEAFAKLTGFAREEVLDKALVDVLDPRDVDGSPLWDGGWGPASRLRGVTGFPEQVIRARLADGGGALLLARGRFDRDLSGRVCGAVIVAREHRPSSRGADGAEAVLAAAHELRAPLTSLKGYSGLMLKRWDRLDDEQKLMMLGQISRDADRVSRMISELLEAARISSGRLVLRRRPTDISSVVEGVLERARVEFPTLEADILLPLGPTITMVDTERVSQVLYNLVENACKYAGEKAVRIEVVDEGEVVSVNVYDEGPGLSQEEVARVFTRLARGRTSKPSGIGMGLWIGSGIVEAHGGSLSFSPPAEGGGCFRFTLPKADPEAAR